MTPTCEQTQSPAEHAATTPITIESLHECVAERLEEACARVPPLWPLKNFVAVNPFVGLSGHHFLDASALVRRVTHGDMMMPLRYYRKQWESEHICESDLQDAIAVARRTLPDLHAEALTDVSIDSMTAALNASSNPDIHAVQTVSDWLDSRTGSQWSSFVVDEISKWCSAYYDEGQASWRMPWRGEPLFSAWKQAAIRDANPEVMGLRNFRSFVASQPDDASAAIASSLQILKVPADGIVNFMHRQLMSIPGWSGYVQYHVREKGLRGKHDNTLHGLLAIRLAYDAALLLQHNTPEILAKWRQNTATFAKESEVDSTLLTSYLWQLAAECAYQRSLQHALQTHTTPKTDTRPAAQAVFCIDVRSEVLRRSIETTSPDIETLGFAGFFGFPIEVIPFGARHGSAQCPVLLTPQFRIRQTLPGASHETIETALHQQMFAKRLAHGWNAFKTSAVSCFSFVETGGLMAGVKIVKDSFGLSHEGKPRGAMAPIVRLEAETPRHEGHNHAHLHASGMSLEQQIAVAANALKHMGLTRFARIVLICGHGSSTTNNPYGSGLDCGACGGHSGEANARVAVTVFNTSEVRAGLKLQGILIPEDTYFAAGLHNTTTDDVTLFDLESAPESHWDDIAQLQRHLADASHQTRLLRAPSMGVNELSPDKVDGAVRARSRDWSQTRPEWGLAGNAGFIAAPRARTRGLDLGGRAFLNEYDYSTDTDGSKLELLMTAPMVVASWINLQYFASTVNNRLFGSGNKTTHNVVGTIGVWQGNCGDLQVGLPLQSVHDGDRWMHEPLRLSVFVEAPTDALDAVIQKHPSVRELLDNGWMHLFAIEADAQMITRYVGRQKWKEENASIG